MAVDARGRAAVLKFPQSVAEAIFPAEDPRGLEGRHEEISATM
jgi:hypothetical protein